ncbi:hypothetical protein CHS0354_000771 [Potamilus streckersoni]|uniref:Uncharacterized protein n=1 Tax=Potamilus streckersoni TaxID=2493646 RepID=A0AAE0T868_9BIVA|nr:hypothetical protein CHS0354_000771 [Potamilus streckersoni]
MRSLGTEKFTTARKQINVLTIGGSDTSGGSGVQADLRAITALGCHGLSVVTAVTAQNSSGIAHIESMSEESLKHQLECVKEMAPLAIKIGMLYSNPIIDIVGHFISTQSVPIILDTPMQPTLGGLSLLKNDALTKLKQLVPLVTMITPNIPEAEILLGRPIHDNEHYKKEAVWELIKKGSRYVLLKDGHSENTSHSVDYFCDGSTIHALSSPRIKLLNNDIYFCGERVPLSELEVFEAFERDFLMNVNDRTQMTMFIKRAGRFFPFIEGELKKAGLPDDLKYLMVAESGMLDVVSQAGAAGFWQIMVKTGRHYGLEVNKVIDERYHLLRSTQVAIQYLKDAFSQFKSWCLTAAAYNMGIDGMSIMLKNQAKNNYFELWLNRETIRYVYRITAIKEIMQNKEKYGYGDVIPYKPLYLTLISVSQKIPDLVAWASNNGYSYKDIKYLNTWIKKDYLPAPTNSIKQYMIFLPANGKLVSTK